MSNTRIVLVLFILSEGLGAWFSAYVLFHSRSLRDGRRTTLGLLLGTSFFIYGAAQVFGAFNAFKYGPALSECLPSAVEGRSLITSGMRAFSVWTVAFAFGTADDPNLIRQGVNKAIERWR